MEKKTKKIIYLSLFFISCILILFCISLSKSKTTKKEKIVNEALRLNNRSYSVGVSKLRHLHVLILAPVIIILTGIILQKS